MHVDRSPRLDASSGTGADTDAGRGTGTGLTDPAIRFAEPGNEQLRLDVVRQILAGDDPDEVFGYSLNAHHLASVAWGSRAIESLRVLGWELSTDLLAVEVDAKTTWGWVAFSGRGSLADVRRGLRTYTPLAGAVAIGSLVAGPEGFRESHRQALAAARVARISGAAITFYDDVALEALAVNDIAAARGFVRHELGPLDGAGVPARELRDTLRAYFAAGQHATSAAAMLGVHERTVGNRLRTVEERLGRPPRGVAAELELALRLRELLIGQ